MRHPAVARKSQSTLGRHQSDRQARAHRFQQTIGRKLFPAAGFELVYDKSYPLGTQDYAPVIKAAKAANPDAFIAYSYPPDTFGLTDQANIENFNVKAYYSAVATAFLGFYQKFGPAAENVLGAGGIKDTPEIRAYYKAHKEVTGVDADYWGSPFYYSLLQMITQSIEGVGSMDLKAITAYLKSHTFKTIVGELDIRNQKLDKFYTEEASEDDRTYHVHLDKELGDSCTCKGYVYRSKCKHVDAIKTLVALGKV